MRLTPSQVTKLQEIARKGFAFEMKASAWIRKFMESEGIGHIHGRNWVVTYKDIQPLKEFLERLGHGVEEVPKEVLNSRIDTAKHYEYEKHAKPVTEGRLLISAPRSGLILGGQAMPVRRAFDVTVTELLSLAPKQVLVVENLASFLELYGYPLVTDHIETDCIVIYRGGIGYSAKSLVIFLEAYEREVIGFFDYDPAGLCQLGHKGIQQIIVPELSFVEKAGMELTQPHLFQDQIAQYAGTMEELSKIPCQLGLHANLMKINSIGVSQERLMSCQVPLEVVGVL